MISTFKRRLKHWLYSKCPFFIGRFRYFGVRTYFPPDSHIFNRLCQEGIYEHDNIETIKKLLRPDTIYFDVGANIGLMAIPILVSHPSVRVVSYEPSENSLHYLQETQRTSGFGARWEVVGKAISNAAGQTAFCRFTPECDVFSGIQNTGRAGDSERVFVPAVTLDEEWQRLGKPSVAVIKLDIEGAELKALEGARSCLQTAKPYVLLEWNENNLGAFDINPSVLIQFADQMAYKVLALPRWIPVPSAGVLRLFMLETESFLLVPNDGNS